MKTRAAVAWQAGAPLSIETVDLDGPRAGEVLVEVKATGICHTDHYTLSGADPEGLFPAILGHEGAGVVVDVGPGVTTLKKDDHVIPLYTPECRQCKFCLSRKTNLCQLIRGTQGRGLMPDATSRFSLNGKPILHYMGTSTFSNYIVVPEIALAKIRSDAPFDKVCYIGCGVTTGVGAVIFTAKVEAGANVVVFGLGGIGLNVIQGAKMVGADKIIGIDINPAREAMARQFGMTHFLNPKEHENIVDAIVQLTDGGADVAVDPVGGELCEAALRALRDGGRLGTAAGYAAAVLSNAVSRRALGRWLERVLWSDPRAPLPFALDTLPERRHLLTAANLREVVLASCSIPFWLDAVHDVPGGPRGAYWDGGITDYHLHLDYRALGEASVGGPGIAPHIAAGLVLYPHFQPHLVPGWLDKPWRRRHRASPMLDDLVVLFPSPHWVAGLPNGKLPDCNDFIAYAGDDAGRMRDWRCAVAESQRLADEFAEIVTRGGPVLAQPLR